MRRFITLAAITALALSGCGPKNDTNGGTASNPTPGKNSNFNAAMVTDTGGINDHSFNASAYVGLTKAAKELGFEPKVIETKATADYASNLTTLAQSNKYQIIFAVGLLMNDALEQVAPKFPNIKFAIIDGKAPMIPSCAALRFKEQEGSYLAGFLAASTSKTGVIGFVGGMKIPLIEKFEAGYKAGALTANPKIKVLSAYSGSWEDIAKGKALAITQFASGADIIYQAAGKCGSGVINAAADKGDGYYAIGVDSDQDEMAKGHVLTSMIKHVDNAVYDTIKQTQEGHFKPGEQVFGVKEKGVGLSEMKYTKDKVNPAVLANIDKLSNMIADGKLMPPSSLKELATFVPPVLVNAKPVTVTK